MSTLTIREKNAASDKPRWATRARQIARRAKARNPQALAYVELYGNRRPLLTLLLMARYVCVGYNLGKVLYLRRNLRGWTKVGRARKWDLGNGKHAVAVRVRHRTTGQHLVIVVPHLTWQHQHPGRRHGETIRLTNLIEQTFPGLPVLAIGDWNDSRKSIATRPHDTSGSMMRRRGFHDLETDVPVDQRRNRGYNSAHPPAGPVPVRSIHLDRGFGTDEIEGLAWGLEIHGEPYDADHWALDLTIRINRKAPS